MVIGKAGVGKSYLINSLLKSDLAYESGTDDIGTQEITKYSYQGVEISDTPGLFDSETDPKIALKHYIGYTKPSLLIVCYDATERRLSDQDLKLVKLLKELFGQSILDKTVFVLTQTNIVCSRDGPAKTMEVINSKISTLYNNGAKYIIPTGDKNNKICNSEWMTEFWSITIQIVKSNPSIIYGLSQIQPESGASKTAYNQARQNTNGCISQDAKLGGNRAGDLKVGDIINQNGQNVKVLFIYKHNEPQYMIMFRGGQVTAEHYILENGQYIKAKDSERDIGQSYGLVMYIVTELDDLYFDSGFVASTYVWNYWIMKILHIPFRIILKLFV